MRELQGLTVKDGEVVEVPVRLVDRDALPRLRAHLGRAPPSVRRALGPAAGIVEAAQASAAATRNSASSDRSSTGQATAAAAETVASQTPFPHASAGSADGAEARDVGSRGEDGLLDQDSRQGGLEGGRPDGTPRGRALSSEGDGEDPLEAIAPRMAPILDRLGMGERGAPLYVRFEGEGLPVEEVRRLAPLGELWVDARPATADDALDLLVAGASRIVLWQGAMPPEELEDALLATGDGAILGVDTRDRVDWEATTRRARDHGAPLLVRGAAPAALGVMVLAAGPGSGLTVTEEE